MSSIRKHLVSALPAPVLLALKALRKKFWELTGPVLDRVVFPVWLVYQCARHGKKAVIVYRYGVLGDVICTLPMCIEVRKQHPARLIIFLTSAAYGKMVSFSHAADCVYGSWSWEFSVSYHLLGLIEKIYTPRNTDERSNAGAQCHLVDDLAASCGITLSDRQPRLFIPPALIKKVKSDHGLSGERLIIGINGGHTWPVREWDVEKWQLLVDRIHAGYDVTIVQFGFPQGPEDPYNHLKGVQSMMNRLHIHEAVALIAGCQLIVSIDSGPVHVAGAVGTPVVGLFGAVNPRYRLPPDSPAVGVFSDVPCLFCHHLTPLGHWKNGCPNNIRCMKELGVESVFQAVKSMLSKRKHLGAESLGTEQ